VLQEQHWLVPVLHRSFRLLKYSHNVLERTVRFREPPSQGHTSLVRRNKKGREKQARTKKSTFFCSTTSAIRLEREAIIDLTQQQTEKIKI